jgi:hypothetical protein
MKKINTKELWERLEAQGFDTLAEFHKKAEIPRTYETIRAAFRTGRVKSPETYFVILKYLGFTRLEIKERLLSIGDKELTSLIDETVGGTEPTITPEHLAILGIIDKFRGNDPKMSIFTSVYRAVAKGLQIDISDEMKVLERTPYKD